MSDEGRSQQGRGLIPSARPAWIATGPAKGRTWPCVSLEDSAPDGCGALSRPVTAGSSARSTLGHSWVWIGNRGLALAIEASHLQSRRWKEEEKSMEARKERVLSWPRERVEDASNEWESPPPDSAFRSRAAPRAPDGMWGRAESEIRRALEGVVFDPDWTPSKPLVLGPPPPNVFLLPLTSADPPLPWSSASSASSASSRCARPRAQRSRMPLVALAMAVAIGLGLWRDGAARARTVDALDAHLRAARAHIPASLAR